MEQSSFFYQAMVYLASAVLFVPLVKRLGMGSILGYLLAGIIIGPFVLGLVGEEGQDVMHVAEFGVVMMLFLIGLDLEPKVLWKLRKSILGLGSLQVVVSALLIGSIIFAAGFNWQQALAIGMILALSSTALVMQSLTEKGLTKTAAGRSAFSVLLFQDIAVIPMLAIIPFLATVSVSKAPGMESSTWIQGQAAWLQALIVLGSIAFIIITGRLLVHPLLRLFAQIRLRELFTAFALLLVVSIAVLMEKVGLSPALGAFLAGVVLANSEYRHELESDIEPFKGLLLGLFFMAVGASMDFHLVASKPWLVLSLVAALFLVKILVLFLLGKIFRLSVEQNFIFSFSLGQAGEFAFVLSSFAFQEGVMPSGMVSMITAVVAISMGLTPLVMLLNEKLILSRVGTKVQEERPADDINEKNPVIIAGFGNFGNTVGRFLRANNIQATYLDINSDTVDVLRKMGFNVFYGDASRHDLLLAAGAREAKIIVIAFDDREKRLRLIETVKKHFPHLHMLVRTTDRYDAYDQMNAGLLNVYRETLDTSLRVGVDAMIHLGYNADTARRLAKTFFLHDESSLKKLAAIRNKANEEEYISEARKHIEEIELIIKADRQAPALETNNGLNAESLHKETDSVN